MTIEFRHYQLLNDAGDPTYWDGLEPKAIFETPTPPQGFNNSYQDFTCDVSDIDTITISYETEKGNDPLKQEVSDEFELTGEAATFVKDWLYNRPYSSKNVIEVRLTDTRCKRIIDEFVIRPGKIRVCDGDGCRLSCVVQANDRQYNCLAKYKISDDTNGFLSQDFRAYRYAVEKRPAVMTALFYVIGVFVLIFGITIIPLSAAINLVIAAINAFFPANPPINFTFPTPADYVDFVKQIVGLGRAHPAASFADYIENVCGICNIPIDRDNNLFFMATLETPSGTIANPYTSLDILFAQSDKGRDEDDGDRRKILDHNVPLWTLPKLLNAAADWADAKWYISPASGLKFLPRLLYAETPIYRFVSGCDNDEIKVLSICADAAFDRPLSAISYEWGDDSADFLASDAKPKYGSLAGMDETPNLLGTETKPIPFGGARFRDDGVRSDYIRDAFNSPAVLLGVTAIFILFVLLIMLAVASISANPITATTPATLVIVACLIVLGSFAIYLSGTAWFNNYNEDVLVMSQDICSLPKLLLWDGNDTGNAKVVTAANFPAPNVLHNSDQYNVFHAYYEAAPILRNYAVVTDCNFEGNTYDHLWSWSDTRNYSIVEYQVTIECVLCCGLIELFGLYSGLDRAIDKLIEYEIEGIVKEAVIDSISINYETGETTIKAIGR